MGHFVLFPAGTAVSAAYICMVRIYAWFGNRELFGWPPNFVMTEDFRKFFVAYLNRSYGYFLIQH